MSPTTLCLDASDGRFDTIQRFPLGGDMEENIEIVLLNERPWYVPRLAQIWIEVFGQKWPETPIQEVITWYSALLNQMFPFACVAVSQGRPIGMCSLEINDGIPSDCTPWVADLCIVQAYQGQGIGKLLLRAVQDRAKSIGFKKLYLFIVEDRLMDYYTMEGWEAIGTDLYKGHEVTILSRTLL